MTTTSATGSTTSQAILAALNGSSTTSSSGGTSATQSAQDRFLKLLTTQLQNQDPLNPLDNAQMTSQLAQISTVDGITQLNSTLQTLLGSVTSSQNLQAASLVGKGVLVAGNSLLLQSGSSLGGVELASAADDVTVTIKDANGLAVRTIDLGSMAAGVNDFQWDGKTDSGATAADGSYTISIKASQGGNSITATALQLGVVSGVTLGSQGATLDLGTLGAAGMSDIKQIL